MSFTPIHVHMLVKGHTNKPLKNPVVAKVLLKQLVEVIGMKPVTEPQAVYVSDAGNEGLTGSINLATSHIAFHIWDNNGLIMFDVYSCTSYDVNLVLEFLNKNFNVDYAEYSVLNRDLNTTYTDIYTATQGKLS